MRSEPPSAPPAKLIPTTPNPITLHLVAREFGTGAPSAFCRLRLGWCCVRGVTAPAQNPSGVRRPGSARCIGCGRKTRPPPRCRGGRHEEPFGDIRKVFPPSAGCPTHARRVFCLGRQEPSRRATARVFGGFVCQTRGPRSSGHLVALAFRHAPRWRQPEAGRARRNRTQFISGYAAASRHPNPNPRPLGIGAIASGQSGLRAADDP